MSLFRGLNDEQLKSVAVALDEKTFPEAEMMFEQGDPADAMYIIFRGKVDIIRHVKEQEIKVASLVQSDYFGEQGLLRRRNRNASVRAEGGTTVLVLYRDTFRTLVHKLPGLRENFEIMMASHNLANRLRFRWLAHNESIYFLARRHPVLLYQQLIFPVGGLIVTLILLALAYVLNSITLAVLGGFGIVADLLWMLWLYIDWGNDYYIVTNQRVIWLEKVIGLYDSRQEAPMSTILSVSTETDQIGRMFDYGTVVVRTFTGQIRMHRVRHPKQAGAMIEEYWLRSKEHTRKSEEESIKEAIRTKIGVKPKAKPAPPPEHTAKPSKQARPSLWEQLLANAFRLRKVEGEIITFNKHWFVLARDTFFGLLLLVGLVAGPFAWSFLFSAFPPLWLLLLGSVVLGVDLLWLGYQYVDWKNDIYQVTTEQIIDVNRKPFGTEDRKAAPLENILSTEYKREGILGNVLNFGTVYIMVGGAQFNFENVADPPSVLQDITRRQQARLAKKHQAESAAERERMTEWLAMYHRTIQEMRQADDQSPNAE